MFSTLEVGKPYAINVKGTEGVILDYTEGGFQLSVIYNGMSEAEANDLKEGHYKFGICTMNGILFFCSQFGTKINMSEAPFHFGLYSDPKGKIESMTKPEELVDGMGMALDVLGIDSSNNILKSYRRIGLSTEISKELVRICMKQANTSMSKTEFGATLNKIFSQYSSEDLYRISFVKCEQTN